MLVDVLARDRVARTAAGHPENIGKISVARDVSADQTVAAAVAMPENGCAGAVAEKHASVAFRPIGNRAQLFRADYKNGIVSVAGDKLLGDLDCEKETGTSR